MQKGMGTAIGVWVAAIASAVVVIHQVEHPMRWTERAPHVVSRAIGAAAANGMPEGDAPRVDVEDVAGYVEVLPPATITGRALGAAEMQGSGGVVIGEGVVTHP
ncbi:MAG: hypothetical protein ACRELB_24780 [Polyangiaceae bacterium]